MSGETLKLKIKARVKVCVEVDLSDTWDGDAPMSQVNAQAAKAAVERVSLLLSKGKVPYGIVGSPEVTAVITTSTVDAP